LHLGFRGIYRMVPTAVGVNDTPAALRGCGAPLPDTVADMSNHRSLTITLPSNSETAATPTCADRLCELAGRDRAVATRLRDGAARLLKLADALEANGSIAVAAAADILAE
jgi:hypothetical protein